MLDQVETQEYKYPNQVYKVPVQTGLFDHFIMPALFKMPQFGFHVHYYIDDHPAEYVETMEAGNTKEVTAKCRAPNVGGMQV